MLNRLNDVNPETFVKTIVNSDISLDMLEKSMATMELNSHKVNFTWNPGVAEGCWPNAEHEETMLVPLTASEQGVVTTVLALGTGDNLRRVIRAAAPGSIQVALWGLNYFDISSTIRNCAISQVLRLLWRPANLGGATTEVRYRIWTPDLIGKTVERGGYTPIGNHRFHNRQHVFCPQWNDSLEACAWRMAPDALINHNIAIPVVDVVVPNRVLTVPTEPDEIDVAVANLDYTFNSVLFSETFHFQYYYLSNSEKWWVWLLGADVFAFANSTAAGDGDFNQVHRIAIPVASWIDHVIAYAGHDVNGFDGTSMPLAIAEIRANMAAFRCGFVTAYAQRTRNWNIGCVYPTAYGGSINIRPTILSVDSGCYMWWPDVPLSAYLPINVEEVEPKFSYLRRALGPTHIARNVASDPLKAAPHSWASDTELLDIEMWNGPTIQFAFPTTFGWGVVGWSWRANARSYVTVPVYHQSIPGLYREDEVLEPVITTAANFDADFFWTRRVPHPVRVQDATNSFRPVRFHV